MIANICRNDLGMGIQNGGEKLWKMVGFAVLVQKNHDGTEHRSRALGWIRQKQSP